MIERPDVFRRHRVVRPPGGHHTNLKTVIFVDDVTAKGAKIISKIIERYTVYLEEMLKDLEPQTVDSIKYGLEVLLKAINRQESI